MLKFKVFSKKIKNKCSKIWNFKQRGLSLIHQLIINIQKYNDMKNLVNVVRMERTSTKQGAFTVAVSDNDLQLLENQDDVIIIWKRKVTDNDRINPITHEVK